MRDRLGLIASMQGKSIRIGIKEMETNSTDMKTLTGLWTTGKELVTYIGHKFRKYHGILLYMHTGLSGVGED